MRHKQKISSAVAVGIVLCGLVTGCADGKTPAPTTTPTKAINSTNSNSTSSTASLTSTYSTLLATKMGFVPGPVNADAPMSREQFVMALEKSLNIDPASDKTLPSYAPFADIPSSDPALPYIKWAVEHGWISQLDYTGFNFNPTGAMTKEEAVAILAHVLTGPDTNGVAGGSGFTYADESKVNPNYRSAAYLLTYMNVVPVTADHKFNPTQPLTQDQGLTLIFKALSTQANMAARLESLQQNPNTSKALAIGAYELAPNGTSLAIMAYQDFESGNLDNAIQLYQDAIKQGDNNPYVYSALALAYYQKKDYTNAVIWQKQAVQRLTKDPVQYILLSQYLMLSGNLTSANQALNQAKKLDTTGTFTKDIALFQKNVSNLQVSLDQNGQGNDSNADIQNLFLTYDPNSPNDGLQTQQIGWNIGNALNTASKWIDKHQGAILVGTDVLEGVSAFLPPPADAIGEGVAFGVREGVQANAVYRDIADHKGTGQTLLDTAFLVVPGGLKVGETITKRAVQRAEYSSELWNTVRRIDDADPNAGSLSTMKYLENKTLLRERSDLLEKIETASDVTEDTKSWYERLHELDEESHGAIPQKFRDLLTIANTVANSATGGRLDMFALDQGLYIKVPAKQTLTVTLNPNGNGNGDLSVALFDLNSTLSWQQSYGKVVNGPVDTWYDWNEFVMEMPMYTLPIELDLGRAEKNLVALQNDGIPTDAGVDQLETIQSKMNAINKFEYPNALYIYSEMDFENYDKLVAGLEQAYLSHPNTQMDSLDQWAVSQIEQMDSKNEKETQQYVKGIIENLAQLNALTVVVQYPNGTKTSIPM